MNGNAPLVVQLFKRVIGSDVSLFLRNASLPVARFIIFMKHATDNSALPFVYLKFYISHFYF
jgi:hypothetical protein